MRLFALVSLFLALAGATFAQSSDPTAQRGLTYALANCAQCHATDKVSQSPINIAPPFRELHKRFPDERLREALLGGITASHPTMPQFRLDPGQATDFIAYLKSLQ
jgi:mono/diheme cytochrome c family protein